MARNPAKQPRKERDEGAEPKRTNEEKMVRNAGQQLLTALQAAVAQVPGVANLPEVQAALAAATGQPAPVPAAQPRQGSDVVSAAPVAPAASAPPADGDA